MAKFDCVWALGAMSGTSLDGIDAAKVLTDGVRIFEFGETRYQAYSEAQRGILRDALGTWEGARFEAAAEVVETAHAELLARFDGADLVGFHGQTTAHRPEAGQTHQAGNGKLLAEALGTPVVWDFRSADMKLGGQGAPLAPFFHFALAKHIEADAPLAFVNIGGVSNLTWLDPRFDAPEAVGACLAFDCGPGNAKIDDIVQERLGKQFDEDGDLAAAGTVDADVLDAMLGRDRYFSVVPPKSLDRNDFSDWGARVSGLSVEDALATLTAGTAAAIAKGLEHCPEQPTRLLIAGGGRRNAEMMRMLEALVDVRVEPVENVGLDGDMIEAQAFAYLAVRVMRGLPTSAPGTTGVAAPIGGGQVSRPGEISLGTAS